MAKYREITFTDADVVNLDDWIPSGESNPHNVRPWLLHDHGFCVCIVFASDLSDALDIAADNGYLEHFQLTKEDVLEYYTSKDGYESCGRLGNASEPFDIDCVHYLELPNSKRSFVAQWEKANE